MEILGVAILFLIFPFARLENQTSNQILFSYIGDTARESGFGHLILPIPTERITKIADTLGDLMDVRTDYGGNFNNSFGEIERYGILQIKEKIELILSLASKDGFVAKEMETDDINVIKTAMSSLSRKRRSITSVAKLLAAALGISAFGSLIHNWASLSQVQETLDKGMQKQEALIETLDDAFLRMEQVNQFVDKRYQEVVTHMQALENQSKRDMANRLDHYLHMMLLAFRIGLQDFMQGITELMEHRLSPLLVSANHLVSVFNKLIEEAGKRGMRPLSEDVGVLFQAPTSTFAVGNGQLLAVIHIPLYTGSRLRLYKYLPAPFFMYGTHMMVTVESPAEYLALDTHQTVGKQLTASEFQLCTKSAEIFHCPPHELAHETIEFALSVQFVHSKAHRGRANMRGQGKCS